MVSGPQMPSAVSPQLRWKSVMARRGVRAEDAVDPVGDEAEAAEAGLEVGDVVAPEHRRGARRAAGRRAASPASTRAFQVWAPQMSSTRSPRASWKRRTAVSVCVAVGPGLVARDVVARPSRAGRWRSGTASPATHRGRGGGLGHRRRLERALAADVGAAAGDRLGPDATAPARREAGAASGSGRVPGLRGG